MVALTWERWDGGADSRECWRKSHTLGIHRFNTQRLLGISIVCWRPFMTIIKTEQSQKPPWPSWMPYSTDSYFYDFTFVFFIHFHDKSKMTNVKKHSREICVQMAIRTPNHRSWIKMQNHLQTGLHESLCTTNSFFQQALCQKLMWINLSWKSKGRVNICRW